MSDYTEHLVSMAGGDGDQLAAAWPPPLASREIRRHCAHQIKAGYCAFCGTKVTV